MPPPHLQHLPMPCSPTGKQADYLTRLLKLTALFLLIA